MDSVTTAKKINAAETIESIDEYFWNSTEYDQISNHLREYFDEYFADLPDFDAMCADLDRVILEHRPLFAPPTIAKEERCCIRYLHEAVLQLIDQYLN